MDAFDKMLQDIEDNGYTEDEIGMLEGLEEYDSEKIIILFFRFFNTSKKINDSLVEICKLYQEADLIWREIFMKHNLQSVIVPDYAYREDLLDD